MTKGDVSQGSIASLGKDKSITSIRKKRSGKKSKSLSQRVASAPESISLDKSNQSVTEEGNKLSESKMKTKPKRLARKPLVLCLETQNSNGSKTLVTLDPLKDPGLSSGQYGSSSSASYQNLQQALAKIISASSSKGGVITIRKDASKLVASISEVNHNSPSFAHWGTEGDDQILTGPITAMCDSYDDDGFDDFAEFFGSEDVAYTPQSSGLFESKNIIAKTVDPSPNRRLKSPPPLKRMDSAEDYDEEPSPNVDVFDPEYVESIDDASVVKIDTTPWGSDDLPVKISEESPRITANTSLPSSESRSHSRKNRLGSLRDSEDRIKVLSRGSHSSRGSSGAPSSRKLRKNVNFSSSTVLTLTDTTTTTPSTRITTPVTGTQTQDRRNSQSTPPASLCLMNIV